MEPSEQLIVERAALEALRQRAEAMARGDFRAQGEPVGGAPEIEDLRRAIDVLGMHTAQGLREQHTYVAALSTAQEAERGRLARELHDEIVQQLIAFGHSIERAQRLISSNPEGALERLRALRAGITELVGGLRTIIGDLRPPALEELGLLPAVELLLQRSGDGGPQVRLELQGEPRRLAPQSELALFRIIQEAWSNMRRHARASEALLRFCFERDALLVSISDNGQGFALQDEPGMQDGHWGLRGMRERAELAGGSLTVTSQPGQGTRIETRIPYPGVGGHDPVCGMSIGPDALGAELGDQIYRFCSPACRDLFLAQPGQYVAPR